MYDSISLHLSWSTQIIRLRKSHAWNVMIHSNNSITQKSCMEYQSHFQEVILAHTFGPGKTPTGKWYHNIKKDYDPQAQTNSQLHIFPPDSTLKASWSIPENDKA